jgi:parallel beta-helix repeat protein
MFSNVWVKVHSKVAKKRKFDYYPSRLSFRSTITAQKLLCGFFRERLEETAVGGLRLVHRSLLIRLLISLALIFRVCGCSVTCTVAPSISGQPVSQTVVIGQPALFTVAASGSAPLSYTWLKNGVAIPGASSPSYMTPPTSSGDSGSVFTVTVQNKFGALTSNPANLAVSSSSNDNIRFVAPAGDDSNPGTIDEPFRTIQHCTTVVTQGWTCAIRAGTYRETVTPNSGITIRAYNLESVVIDGSDPVTGWTPYQGAIFKAKVSMRADDTNQLFVGSDMMTEARWPNGDNLFDVHWAIAREGTNTGQVVDPNLPQVDWTGAKIHLWSGSDPFGHETGQVTASGNGQISLSGVEAGTCPEICPESGGYYYLFGTLAALDVEREWYYDPSSETLYFMAPGKADPNTIDVRSKQRRYAFDLRGRSGVTIQNIGIFACSIVMDNESSNNTLDRINAQYVSQFTNLQTASTDPSGSQFSILMVHAADSGIVLNGTGNTLQNSTISYSAGTGVAVEGSNNTVRNNLIQNVDYVGDYASGIVIDGNGNSIQNNTVNTVGRQAILMDAVLNEDVSYNDLTKSMLLSRDGAAIYACCNQVASGTRVHHNWIHDSAQVVVGTGDAAAVAGISIDNGSSGFDVDQNVLWNNHLYNIVINGAGSGGPNTNYIHNNTIPDSSSGADIVVGGIPDCTATRIIDNRVVLSVRNPGNGSLCSESNNDSSAPGATEMTLTIQVGCNFEGCSSDPPPAIGDGNSVTPCPVTLAATDAVVSKSAGRGGDRTFETATLQWKRPTCVAGSMIWRRASE